MKGMNIIPIVFCFDDNWEMPAGVCLTSLLENANQDTFYDIFILHDSTTQYIHTTRIKNFADYYSNCRITFRSVGDLFCDAFEIRGITNSTYYRLLIPELIPEYDKIMYHDVDVIFRSDLSEVFMETNMEGYYVAGVNSSGGLSEVVRSKRAKLGLDWREYILAGNIILNSKEMRKDFIVEKFKKEVANSEYEYQDMDIINLVCKGKIKRMPPVFCGTYDIFKLAANQTSQPLYTLFELKEVERHGIVHYNGPKPWNGWCPNFDIWWEYYRHSVYFDAKHYFAFYHSKVNELDRLSLWKRVKLVLRYFTTGQLKK